ncbi:MAG: sensory rhodopsin transducer [Candidatus Omnitrophota bacterium]
MKTGGAKIWYFPDGYLPEKTGEANLEAYEALMLLNVNDAPAEVRLDFYFEDRQPVKDIPVKVGAERRVVCLQLDKPECIGGLQISPLTQYSIRVRSNLPIVAQFGRLDTTQTNLPYYCASGLWEEP